MSGLLPHVVREAVEQKSLFAASASFGLVALILLFVLLVEWDGIESSAESRRVVGLGAVVLPLFVAVLLTLAARVAHIVP